MKYDTDHVGYCHKCGACVTRTDQWFRALEEGRVLRLWCRPCFLKAHPDSAAHGPRFTHPEDAR